MVVTTFLFSLALAAAKEPPKTVFFGDSITEGWKDEKVLGEYTVNRGVSGETTTQMRGRFRKDVLDEKPAQVHFLMGTNDIAENDGPYSPHKTKDNIEWMVKQAKDKKIRVILASLLPCFPRRTTRGVRN